MALHPTVTDIVPAFIRLGFDSNHTGEVIPYGLAHRACRASVDGVGVLALHMGPANWPVGMWNGYIPEDPAGTDWAPVGPKHGKHYLDGTSRYPYGGLGIAHCDSGWLRDCYSRWGAPRGVHPSMLTRTFDQVMDSGARDAWLAWSDQLLARVEVHLWLVETWLSRFWAPAVASNPDLATTAVNARVRNSASGLGRTLAGRSVEEQVRGYVEYKRRERGDGAAERAERQARYAMRVGVILAEVHRGVPRHVLPV